MTQQTQAEQSDKNMHWAEGPDFWEVMDRQVSQNSANYNPVGGDGERACANCQWFVPQTDACVIVQGFPQPIVSNGVSDLWRAVVLPSDEMDPIPVRIVEGSSHLDNESETSDKATKTEGGVEFNASDFAVVPDTDTPSGWKLRLAEDSSGNFTTSQVGRAITAMQPGGFRGNKVQLTTEQKSQAVDRIGRAISKVDGNEEAKDNLRERLDAVKSITIKSEVIRKAKNAFKTTLEAMSSISYKKSCDSGGVHWGDSSFNDNITFTKDKNGALRFVATFSNNFRDRDNPPEVFTEAAHKEFVSYIDGGGEMPELWHWHTPGTKFGKADWIDYDNGFITASGLIDPGHEKEIESLTAAKGLGLSHGYRYIPGKDGDIDFYRTFEISVLPNEKAANPWHEFTLIQSEVKEMFKPDKREYLVKHLGEESVAALENNNEARAKFLNNLGVDSKEFETEEKEAKAEGVTVVNVSTDDIAALINPLTEVVNAMSDRVKTIEQSVLSVTESVKGLQEDDAAKIRAAFAPAFDPTAKRGFVASQEGSNKANKEEEAAASGEMNWFEDLVGVPEMTVGGASPQ